MRIFSETYANAPTAAQMVRAAYETALRNGGTAHDFLHFYAAMFSQTMRATANEFAVAMAEVFGDGTSVRSAGMECNEDGEVYWQVIGARSVLQVTLTLVDKDVADKLYVKSAETEQ